MATRLALAERRPELFGHWIRYWPRRWPAADGDWVHLAETGLGVASPGVTEDLELEAAPDDLLYLPPVREPARPLRDAIAAQAATGGIEPLVQIRLGEPAPPAGLVVYDPLAALLAGDLEVLELAPSGGRLVWPLLPRLTEGEELWEAACRRLEARGVAAVVPVTVRLQPAERRRLVERFPSDEHLFAALFHRPSPAERDFARCAHRFGLEPLWERPADQLPGRRARNRRLAGSLLATAELWERLGRSAAVAQELFAAGRFIDSTSLDVTALASEGNLAPLPWAGGAARPLVEEWAERGRTALWEELRQEYLEGG